MVFNKINSDLASQLNGCKITYESGSFYVTNGSVKKKLGEPRIVSKSWTGSNTATLQFDFASLSDFRTKTADDFYVQVNKLVPFRSGGLEGGSYFLLNKTYNPNNGLLTLNGLYSAGKEINFYVNSITVFVVDF